MTWHQIPLDPAPPQRADAAPAQAPALDALRLLGPKESAAHSALRRALDRLAQPAAPVAPLAAVKAQALEQRGEALLGEAGAFTLRGQGRAPLALSGVIILVLSVLLLLEVLWGGSASTQTLFRMGANHGVHVARGEWWRLLSSGLLHGGAKHLFGNSWCLLLLMPFAVGLLGVSRTLVLLVLSTLGAEALAAWARPTVLGVGLSGGIFGVMASLVTLGLRPGRAVPQLARSSVLGPAGFFLLLNGCTSFQAGVGGMAHLGGALCGALLAGSGLLTVGLTADGRSTPRSRWGYRALALGAVALTALSVLLAFLAGQPWSLRRPALRTVTLLGAPLTLQVPADLGPPRVSASGARGQRFAFGEGLRDVIIVSLITRPLDSPVTDATLAARTAELLTDHKEPGEGLTFAQPPQLQTLASGPAVFLDQRRGPVALPRWLLLRGDRRVDLQLSIAPDATPAFAALAPLIAASVRVDATRAHQPK